MTPLADLMGALREAVALGGPVVAVLGVVSMVALTLVLAKLWQFASLGVGRHGAIRRALAEADAGAPGAARAALAQSPSHLAPALARALRAGDDAARPRLQAETDASFARLESGFRLLDSIAQLAPLLGLFGTVLGMIEAFQALQAAGATVDPSALAGGIWVALLTTAVGLGVAMPASLCLTYLESRVSAERVFAEEALEALLRPGDAAGARAGGPEAAQAMRPEAAHA
jgi:biopolymer transport protein ExbB